MQKYYQNEAKFEGVYSRKNLPKIKDRVYVANLNQHKSIGTHWIAFYVNADNVTYCDSFGVEYNPKEIKEFTENKNMTGNVFRMQENDSVKSR